MPIEMSKKKINVKEKILQETSSLWVENDIIISDTKPDIVKIIFAKGRVYISKTEVMDGRVKIDGKILYNVIYQSTSNTMPNRGVMAVYPFTTMISNSNIKLDTIVKTKGILKKLISSVPNERKISLKSQIEVIVDVYKSRSVEVVDSISSEKNDIELSRVKDNGINYIEYKVETLSGREDILIPIEKPNIYELLDADVKIVNLEYKLSYNKVLVKGDMDIRLIYTGDDERNSIVTHRATEPFAGFIEMQNLKENMKCNIGYDIENMNIKQYDTADKANMISIDYDINIMIETYEDMELEYISDFYSLDRDYRLETSENSMIKSTQNVKKNVSLVEVVPVAISSSDKIMATNCNTENIEVAYNNNEIILSGVLKCDILVHNEETGDLKNKEFEIVLNKNIDIDKILTASNTTTKINADSINAEIQGNDLKITADLSVEVIVSDYINVIGINSAEETEAKNSVDGINIYIVNKGDSLWSIAKKYKTTMQKLIDINDIKEPSKLSVGQKLMIVR